jgi:hypothetical protein
VPFVHKDCSEVMAIEHLSAELAPHEMVALIAGRLARDVLADLAVSFDYLHDPILHALLFFLDGKRQQIWLSVVPTRAAPADVGPTHWGMTGTAAGAGHLTSRRRLMNDRKWGRVPQGCQGLASPFRYGMF